MEDKNDYIDELNWFSEDFDVTQPRTKETKKKPTTSEKSKSKEKDSRVKIARDSSYYKKSSVSSSKSQHAGLGSSHQKIEFKSPISKPERKSTRSREIISIDQPLRKSMKLEKPEIIRYQPVKSSIRAREIGSAYSPEKNVEKAYQPVKSISKFNEKDVINTQSVNTFGKMGYSGLSNLPEKTEVAKIPESISSNINKAKIDTKSLQVLTEKLSLLEERDKLIRSSMEKPSNLKQARSVKGTCPDMCPEKERLMRSLKKMVSVFECSPNSSEMDPNLAIKEYARSSADQEEPLPHELRPEPVLTMAMSYIITRIITTFEECEDISAWYDFCWNRLRAIRKDIVQQQLCDLETVTIVEQCARFHIVCFDRFWGLDSTIFDEKINTENLMNCLKILLTLYGDLRKQGVTCPNEPEFNAYMILIKMNSGDLLWEFLNFPLSLQQTCQVKEAVKIYMYYNSNMYSQFFNYLVKTSYLNACLMQRCFTQLRVNALEVIVKSHCPPNKEGKVSLQHILKSLKFDTKEDALLFCQTCNLRYIERIGFKISYATFTRPLSVFKVRTPSTLICNKRVEFSQAVVGINNEMPVYFERKVHNSFLNEKTLMSDAIDASDQEERMLRDIVERKLLIKNLKNSPAKENINVTNISVTSPPSLQRSLSSLSNRRKSIESDASSVKCIEKQPLFFPEPVDVDDAEEEDLSESEDYDMPDALSDLASNNPLEVDASENVFLDAEDKESLISITDDLGMYLDSQQVSPLSAISDEPLSEEEIAEDEPDQAELSPKMLVESVAEIHEKISPVTIKSFTQPLVIHSGTTSMDKVIEGNLSSLPQPTTPKAFERQTSSGSIGENRINPYILKLKSKLKVNLERLSAKKYGRIWRERVREIKKSYGFVPVISHTNMKEYLKIWGHSVVKPNTIWSHLNNTKKLYSSVDSLLLFNMFDTSLRNLSYTICESLVNINFNQTREDSLRKNGPLYWKLVISVPVSKVTNYNLYQKVLSWSKQVFFSSDLSRNTRIETLICKGIKVHCKIDVTEGDHLDCAKNLSALIMIRVPGWESTNDSQNRLNRLLTQSNHPIPVYVVDLAPSNEYLTPPSQLSVPFYSEISSGIKTFANILNELALNSYKILEKSMDMCDLVAELLDNFLDALQEDCCNSRGFSDSMSDPSNIICLYNMFIDRLRIEILNNYKTNIFGTANEIIHTITPNSKYPINSLPVIIGDYLNSLFLPKLKWPPKKSSSLLQILNDYCEKSGIPQVLSHVIRMINPPDDSDIEQSLSSFLYNLNWLQISEVIIKGYFRTKFCDVIVTYSEKSVNDIIDSHWWMDCGLFIKYAHDQ